LRDNGWGIEEAIRVLQPRAAADGLAKQEILSTIRSAFRRPPRDPCGGNNDIPLHNGAQQKPVTTYRKISVQPETLPDSIEDGAIKFLESKFKHGEWVSIGEGYEKKKNGEITIAITEGVSRTRETWIADIKKRGLDAVFPNALDGLFVRVNPMRNGNGKTDKDVACFRDVLVESDEGKLEDQLGAIRCIDLPICDVAFSGDRSVQAHVQIEAPDELTYRERFGILREYCIESLGLKMDAKNINPSRYSRLPGARRTRRDHDTCQKILDSNGQPITNRMTHEGKPDFRAILSQVSGGTPPGSSSWVLA